MASGSTYTVRSLASRSGFDLEDVIIELVRTGLSYAVDPKATIRHEDERSALAALGMHSASEERKKAYWRAEFSMSAQEFSDLLVQLHIEDSGRTRVLPKGAQAKIRAYAAASVRAKRTMPASPSELKVSSINRRVAPPLVWHQIGQRRVNDFLGADEVETIHQMLEADADLAADPISPPGVRNPDMLESACSRPQTGMPKDAKYPTVEMAAAALVHSLVHNHPFHNGNKRSALVAMMVFLDRNNHWLRDTVEQAGLYLWILEVARHRVLDDQFTYDNRADYEVLAMADWIRKNSRAVERSERPITWRQLRTILVQDYDCRIDARPSSGKVTIHRSQRVFSRNVFRGFRKGVDRLFSFTPAGEGKEVGLGTVKAMRVSLCLTDEFNIDSAIFYGSQKSPDDFISKYQKLLRDLARV